MCGIAGIFGQSSDSLLEGQVNKMIMSLVHRGPDDSGIWINKDNTLAVFEFEKSIATIEINSRTINHMKTRRFEVLKEMYKDIEAARALGMSNNQIKAKVKRRGVSEKVFKDLNYGKNSFQVSEEYSKMIFSIPMHPYLNQEDQDIIIKELKNC